MMSAHTVVSRPAHDERTLTNPNGMLQLTRENVERLAVSLLDVGQHVEAALRTVLSMQRSLERVRQCDTLSPEGALLLQEMARQIESLTRGQSSLDERLRLTARQIASVGCHRAD